MIRVATLSCKSSNQTHDETKDIKNAKQQYNFIENNMQFVIGEDVHIYIFDTSTKECI